MDQKRRELLKVTTGVTGWLLAAGKLGSYSFGASGKEVVWGGSGFNVEFDEINVKLPFVSAALDFNDQIGWRAWKKSVYDTLVEGYGGLVKYGRGEKIDVGSDPGLIFSIGFDYENFVELIVPKESAPNKERDQDIAFYYLFSSIRIYSVELPRKSGGKVTLVYSKPIKSGGSTLFRRSASDVQQTLVMDSLVGGEGSAVVNFSKVVEEIDVTKDYSEPRHIRVRKVSFSDQARNEFEKLSLANIFNANLFAAVAGVSVNDAFDASVVPFIATDYLRRTLARRFSERLNMTPVFENMDERGLASFFIDINIAKVLRKIASETPAQQLISRGLALDIAVYDDRQGKELVNVKLVKVIRSEQVKGVTDDSWYYANNSIGFYELVEEMFAGFFRGVATGDRPLLKSIGVRDVDLSDNSIALLREKLELCRYG